MKNFVANVKLVFQDSFTGGMNKAKASLTGMQDALGDINKGSGLMHVASELSITAGMTEQYRNKLTQALSAPSEAAKGLESSLAAVNTVLTAQNSIGGDVAATYKALEGQSIAWATGTAKGSELASASAAEYAETTYSMLSAGLSANAAMAATAKGLILAKGTMGENRAAADLLATSYNTMGDRTADVESEMTRLSDVIAKTQATFQIANLGQLTEGLKYGIPVAQKYGIAFDQLNSIVGQLNTSGLSGSMAGTAFSSMMAQMLKASDELGFEIAYTEDGGTDVIATLQNLRAQFGDLRDLSPQMQLAFDKAFGQEGGRALTLLSASLDDLSANYDQIASSEGAAAEMAGKMADTYEERQARLENAQNALQATLGKSTNQIRGWFASAKTHVLSFGNSVLQTDVGQKLTYIASAGTMAASGVLSLGGGALNAAAQLATVAAMAEKAGGFMKLFRNGASLVLTPLRMAGGLIKGLGSGLLGVGKSVIAFIPRAAAWATTMWSVAAAHIAAYWPIYAIIAGIALVAAGAYLVIKNWDKVKSWFGGAWETIKGWFSGVPDFFSGVWTSAAALSRTAWNGTTAFFSSMWSSISSSASSIWTGISSAFSSGWEFVKGLFTSGFQFVRNLFAQAPEWVQAALTVFAPFIGIPMQIITHWDEIKTWFTALPEFFSGIWDAVKSGTIGAWEGITGKIAGFVDKLKAPFEWVGDKVGGLFGKDEGEATITAMAGGVEAEQPRIVGAVKKVFGFVGNLLPHSDAKEGPLSELTSSGRAIPFTMAQGMKTDTSLQQAASGMFSNVLQFPSFEPPELVRDSSRSGEYAGPSLSSAGGRVEKHYHVRIEHLELPDVRDMHSLVNFVESFQEEIYREEEAM